MDYLIVKIVYAKAKCVQLLFIIKLTRLFGQFFFLFFNNWDEIDLIGL